MSLTSCIKTDSSIIFINKRNARRFEFISLLRNKSFIIRGFFNNLNLNQQFHFECIVQILIIYFCNDCKWKWIVLTKHLVWSRD